MSQALRVVFMGTPEVAVPTLRVVAERCQVQCVVTQPDRPAGRGRHLRASAVKQAAEELGLPLWQPDSLRGQAGHPAVQGADLFVVFAYGEILSPRFLRLPAIAAINLHCSLLPRWRGASPMQAALRHADQDTGISIQRMVRELDAGPVYARHRLPLSPTTTLPQLHDALAQLGAEAMAAFLRSWPAAEPVAQDPTAVTWCHKLTHEDGHIDWRQAAPAVERQVRAYTPAPGCWTLADGQRLGIQAVRVVDASLAPGQVQCCGRHLVVGCGTGAVAIEQLQPPGKRPMAIAAYLNGHQPPDRCELPRDPNPS